MACPVTIEPTEHGVELSTHVNGLINVNVNAMIFRFEILICIFVVI